MTDSPLETWLQAFLDARGAAPELELRSWADSIPELSTDWRLRVELERRLASHDAESERGETIVGDDAASERTSFLRRGAPSPMPAEDGALRPGQRIGRFVLRSQVGAGGMGQVWEAEDTELRRRVALKFLLRGGVLSGELERFIREARAGGRCSHPSLVATYGNGEDEGLAWIAQEFVDGPNLAEAIRDRREAPSVGRTHYREVAELVARIADGLEAAHQAGVIHRDLKPANILIAEGEVPKVTDFGLARVTGDTHLSVEGELAGTYHYMSPEQVAAKRIGLDHRTDVFSLGVVLYELLTLRKPFEGDTSQQVMQQIITEEPPNPTRLRSQCPRELAVICGKAMEKSADRRYESMAAFAADLRRHLANEPILAKPPGPVTRAMKWARRNPAVSSAAAVGLVALAVVSLLLRENLRTNEELTVVMKFQREQLGGLDPESMGLFLRQGLREKLRERAQLTRRSAEETEALLLEYDRVMAGVNFTGMGLETLSAQILEPRLEEIGKRFEAQPRVKASLLQTVAKTARELGLLDLAEGPQREALEARRRVLGDEHPDTLTSINNMGVLLRAQGKVSEAEPYYREALEARRRVLGDEHPDTLGSISNMGVLLKAEGKLSEAKPYYREALEAKRRVLGNEHPDTLGSINNMGVLLKAQGKLSEAKPYYREALEAKRRVLGNEHPSTLASIKNMGFLLNAQGKLSGREAGLLNLAEGPQRELLEIRRRLLGDEHPDTLVSINNTGSLLTAHGKRSEAEPYYREALEISRRVLGDEHPDTLNSIKNLGKLLYDQGKLSEAELYYREALETSRRVLGNEQPSTLASIHNMGFLLKAQGKLSEAERYLREALETSRAALGDEYPYTAQFLRARLEILRELQRPAEARTLLTEFLSTSTLPEDHALRVEVRGLLEAMDAPPSGEDASKATGEDG